MDYSNAQLVFGICWIIFFPIVLYLPYYFKKKRLKGMRKNIGKVFKVNTCPLIVIDDEKFGEIITKITGISDSEIRCFCYEAISYTARNHSKLNNHLIHYSHIDAAIELDADDDEWLLLTLD